MGLLGIESTLYTQQLPSSVELFASSSSEAGTSSSQQDAAAQVSSSNTAMHGDCMPNASTEIASNMANSFFKNKQTSNILSFFGK
jgi:hypothetical protein